MSTKNWYVITHCERKNAYDELIPAEWFILNAPYATREEAETVQAKIVEDTKGTDAEWTEANESAKIVHRDELAHYGLKPLNESMSVGTMHVPVRSINRECEECGKPGPNLQWQAAGMSGVLCQECLNTVLAQINAALDDSDKS